MKGLIVSLIVFTGYVLGSMGLSHLLKPAFISRIFVPGLLIGIPCYFAVYFLTPVDMGMLPSAWIAHPQWLDAGFGCLVLLLNGHSFIDFFFGFNGGFSMSVMLEILRRQQDGAAEPEIISCYLRDDGFDKIYGWRLPRLANAGMIIIDEKTRTCRLTPSGLRVARFAAFCKKFLNLGLGG